MSCRRWRDWRGGLAASAVAFLLALSLQGTAWAWGEEGHSIVAEIAQRRLNDRAAARVAAILGRGVSLASVSTWADDVRLTRPESYNWHFVDIPLAENTYVPARHCQPTPRGDCIVAVIGRLLATLKDAAATPTQLRESLRYLVHFVADVHQPLHTLLEDQGGNQFPVRLFTDPRKRDRQPTHLHAAWDVGLIRVYYYSWGSYVDFLENSWLPGRDVAALSAGSVVDWAMQSHAHAVKVAYSATKGAEIDNAYLAAARPVIDYSLAAGGLRLARLLNETLGR